MIALYKDPDATELLEALNAGEPTKAYLCFRGKALSDVIISSSAQNIVVESANPDIQVSGTIPETMNDGDIAELTVEWNPSDPPYGGGLITSAQEVTDYLLQ